MTSSLCPWDISAYLLAVTLTVMSKAHVPKGFKPYDVKKAITIFLHRSSVSDAELIEGTWKDARTMRHHYLVDEVVATPHVNSGNV